MRTRRRLLTVTSVAVIVAVGATLWSVVGTTNASRNEPRSGAALVRIAQRFNADYAANRDGLVYDRWDPRSRLVISRGRYIRLHALCSTAPGPAAVDGATPVDHGYWRVGYVIGGVQLTDYWHYVGGRWLFSLQRSNPDAVRLYRMPSAGYMAAVGCSEPTG